MYYKAIMGCFEICVDASTIKFTRTRPRSKARFMNDPFVTSVDVWVWKVGIEVKYFLQKIRRLEVRLDAVR